MPKIYKEGESSQVLFLRWFNSQCHFFLEALGREFLSQTIGLSVYLALCVKWELQPLREAEYPGHSGDFSLQEMKTDELIRSPFISSEAHHFYFTSSDKQLICRKDGKCSGCNNLFMPEGNVH